MTKPLDSSGHLTKGFLLRLPPATLERAKAEAAREGRPLTSWIHSAVLEKLERITKTSRS